MAITDKKISVIYPGRDISSLSDRPNQDGMTATELKARFDQLGKEIIPKINDLIDELFADLYSGTEQTGHTHNIDNLVDGLTYKLFTAVERAKLGAIAEGAEVNQNAFSNVKVGSTTIASTTKTDTFELVAGLNITMTVDALTKKISLSATGDLATEAVQSLIVDIGEYYTSLNVEGALQEVGLALLNKVDKVAGKGLSTEDYTSTEKTKLSGIAENANNYVHPATHLPSIIEQDESNRFVTDTEKTSWNGKQDALVSGTNIKTINGNSVLGGGNVDLLPKNNPVATGTQTLPNIVTNGIKFPATQVPSADPNTLDDYEEGTWTPITSAWTTPATNQNASYVKVGKMVYINALFYGGVVQNFGEISGLPVNVGGHGLCHFRLVSSTNGGTFGLFDTAINNKISSIAANTFTGQYWLLSGTYISTT